METPLLASPEDAASTSCFILNSGADGDDEDIDPNGGALSRLIVESTLLNTDPPNDDNDNTILLEHHYDDEETTPSQRAMPRKSRRRRIREQRERKKQQLLIEQKEQQQKLAAEKNETCFLTMIAILFFLLMWCFTWASYTTDYWFGVNTMMEISNDDKINNSINNFFSLLNTIFMMRGNENLITSNIGFASFTQNLQPEKESESYGIAANLLWILLLIYVWVTYVIIPCFFLVSIPVWVYYDYFKSHYNNNKCTTNNSNTTLDRTANSTNVYYPDCCYSRNYLELTVRFAYSTIYISIIMKLAISNVQISYGDDIYDEKLASASSSFSFAITMNGAWNIGILYHLLSIAFAIAAIVTLRCKSIIHYNHQQQESVENNDNNHEDTHYHQLLLEQQRQQENQLHDGQVIIEEKEPEITIEQESLTIIAFPMPILSSVEATQNSNGIQQHTNNSNNTDRRILSFWKKYVLLQLGIILSILYYPIFMRQTLFYINYDGFLLAFITPSYDDAATSCNKINLFHMLKILLFSKQTDDDENVTKMLSIFIGLFFTITIIIIPILCHILAFFIILMILFRSCFSKKINRNNSKSRDALYVMHPIICNLSFIITTIIFIPSLHHVGFLSDTIICQAYQKLKHDVIDDICLSLNGILNWEACSYFTAYSILLEVYIFLTIRWT